MEKETISVAEMARRLNCSVSNVTYLLRKKAIVGQRTPYSWNVRKEDFEAYIKEYTTIQEAEASIAELEKELEEKRKHMRAKIKRNRTLEWLFYEAINQLNIIFENGNFRSFDIVELYEKGMADVAEEKSEDWHLSKERSIQVINRELRRLIHQLKRMPKYNQLQEENKVLQVKLEAEKLTIDSLMAKLKYYGQRAEENTQIDNRLVKKIADIDFSIRTLNVLWRNGIKTVGQLCGLSQFDLLKMRNLGRKSLNEIEDYLEGQNLSLMPNKNRDYKNVYYQYRHQL